MRRWSNSTFILAQDLGSIVSSGVTRRNKRDTSFLGFLTTMAYSYPNDLVYFRQRIGPKAVEQLLGYFKFILRCDHPLILHQSKRSTLARRLGSYVHFSR